MKKYSKYPIEASDDLKFFEFTSTGKNGIVPKGIIFEPTEVDGLYNLSFGDIVRLLPNSKIPFEIIDDVNTDNGDRDKVLATVSGAVFDFTAKYPETWIIFTGSDDIRTRLYRMAITKNYAELSLDFIIFGLQNINGVERMFPFDSTLRCVAYIIKRKF